MAGSQGLLKVLRDLVRGLTLSGSGPRGGDVGGGSDGGALDGDFDGDDVTLAQSVPERFGPYRVRRKLGQGGMGIVYEAHDEKLERSLAIKVIARDAADEDAIRRFWREARAAAAVNHPNVCQLYEIGEHEGALYIAMELLEGEPLSERLRRGALPLTEALPIAFGMLAALQALHGRGLVHRDRALTVLREVVGRGFAVAPALRRDPLLAAVRAEAGFDEIVAVAEASRQEAQALFERAGGPELLGIVPYPVLLPEGSEGR